MQGKEFRIVVYGRKRGGGGDGIIAQEGREEKHTGDEAFAHGRMHHQV